MEGLCYLVYENYYDKANGSFDRSSALHWRTTEGHMVS